MYKGNQSRVVPIIIVLIVIAVTIAAFVSIGRAIFGDATPSQKTDIGRDTLLSTSVDKSVRMTVRGPIVADEDFRSYQVTISPSSRVMSTYSGYLEQSINTKELGNNSKAYEEFIYALDRANIMKGEVPEATKDDTRGVCASGRVYEFEVLQAGQAKKRLWTSTCRNTAGSLRANQSSLSGLFLDQIPENKALLKEVKL